MIATYSDYIENYILNPRYGCPGEHHFVSTYLLPRLFKIRNSIPDFVNPDGTKKITGDIIYYNNGEPQLAIEVKFQYVKLTTVQYNAWIVDTDRNQYPDVFIGIGAQGMCLLSWVDFRSQYLLMKGIQRPQRIRDRYGSQLSVNLIVERLLPNQFGLQITTQSKQLYETNFLARLEAMIEHIAEQE
jgi:hypothetical protein